MAPRLGEGWTRELAHHFMWQGIVSPMLCNPPYREGNVSQSVSLKVMMMVMVMVIVMIVMMVVMVVMLQMVIIMVFTVAG